MSRAMTCDAVPCLPGDSIINVELVLGAGRRIADMYRGHRRV